MTAFGYKRTSGALVNHSLGGDVTEGYNQLATSDLAEAMQIVTDRMCCINHLTVLPICVWYDPTPGPTI